MVNEIKNLDLTEMGRRIRQRRETLQLSREILAEKIDVSPQFIADIEYGNKGISIKKLFILCQVLESPIDYIMAGEKMSDTDESELERAREEVMEILCRCDAEQLKGISKIAQIYADGVRMK